MAKPLLYRGTSQDSSAKTKSYIISLDVGTTSIRSHVYNEKAEIISVASRMVSVNLP
jgi:glycerol kinase